MEFHLLIRRISEYEIDDDDLPFPPPPPPSHESHIPKIWLLFLCLIGVAALVLITILKRRRSNSNRTQIRTNPETQAPDVGDDQREFLDENHGPVVDHPIWYIRTVGLPQSVIDSIAIFKFRKDDGLTEETDCTICLSKFLEEETLRLLPKCSHAFHIPCIDTWLRSHQNCPLCRAPVVNAQTSPPEPNSDQLQETQVENLEDSGGGVGGHEQVIRTESSGGLTGEVSEDSTMKNPLRTRVQSDIGDHRLQVEEELQPLRRSVSLDASSASVIYLAVSSNARRECEGSSSGQLAQVNKSSSKKVFNGATISRLMKSASFGYSLQKGPASMKRSFSSFRRMSSRRHCRSQESILPL